MPTLTYDRFHRYDELTAFLHAWADERPSLVKVESFGRSWQGRDLWLVTLTNIETGPASEKPGFLVEAGIHAVEWTAGMAALHLIQTLGEGHGADPRITRLLDTRCVYVVPRLNPDGTEEALGGGRYIRSSMRPHPSAEAPPGLREGDVDGDGRQLFMRVRDPEGAFVPHPDEPRLLVPRAPDGSGEGPRYRLLPEGRITGWDGSTIRVADAVEGLDLGANFPGDRSRDVEHTSAGPFPGSEPEVAAYLAAVAARPNICGYVTCHDFGGVLLTPPHNDDDPMPYADRRAIGILGARATELTGYRVLSYADLKIDKAQVVRGTQSQWFYDRLGVPSWITEFWSPWQQAGVDLGDGPASLWLGGDHRVEDDLRLIRWSDEELGGRGYVDWYPFDHPELGPVELGGWDKINSWYNAPLDRVEAEVAPHTEWLVFHALAGPLLAVRSLDVEAVGEGVWHVVLVVENTGWLPTHVTRRALDRQAVGPLTCTLELPDGATFATGSATIELGQLDGRIDQRASSTWWSYRADTTERARAAWVVSAPAGAVVVAVARHPRAGTVRASVVLGSP